MSTPEIDVIVNTDKIRKEQSDEIGKGIWTLRSLIETFKGIMPAHVPADIGRNYQLAIEHLEDAQHRLERVDYEYDKIL